MIPEGLDPEESMTTVNLDPEGDMVPVDVDLEHEGRGGGGGRPLCSYTHKGFRHLQT